MPVVGIPRESLPEQTYGQSFVNMFPGWGGAHATPTQRDRANQTIASLIDFIIPTATRDMPAEDISGQYSGEVFGLGAPLLAGVIGKGRSLKDLMRGYKDFKSFINVAEKVGLVKYHGTPYGKFSRFKESRLGTGADATVGVGDWGQGFYFLDDMKSAQGYASGLSKIGVGNQPYIHKAYLDIKKPFTFDKYYAVDRALMRGKRFSDSLKKFKLTRKEFDLADDILSSADDNWMGLDIAEPIKKLGYDSMITPYKEILVFDSRRIKTLEDLKRIFKKNI